MNEAECRSADWHGLGWRDGLAGLRPYIHQYEHACAASKVQVAEKEYLAGWQEGKWEYDRRVHGSDCCDPR